MKKCPPSLVLAFLLAAAVNGQEEKPKPKFEVPDINGRATVLVKPENLVGDAAFEADGTTLAVKVSVDTSGNPVSAKCSETCHAAMKAAAEQAAMSSKFAPLVVRGETVEYQGTLLYTVAFERVDWFNFGTALKSTHVFDNISLGPVAAKLPNKWAEEKARLLAIDDEKDVNKRIATIEEMIRHFREKLKGKELWLFSTGMAVRNITFWLHTGPIEKGELQAAIAKLAAVADEAPSEIPREFVAALKEISEYKIDPTLTDRKLREEIFKVTSKLRNFPR